MARENYENTIKKLYKNKLNRDQYNIVHLNNNFENKVLGFTERLNLNLNNIAGGIFEDTDLLYGLEFNRKIGKLIKRREKKPEEKTTSKYKSKTKLGKPKINRNKIKISKPKKEKIKKEKKEKIREERDLIIKPYKPGDEKKFNPWEDNINKISGNDEMINDNTGLWGDYYKDDYITNDFITGRVYAGQKAREINLGITLVNKLANNVINRVNDPLLPLRNIGIMPIRLITPDPIEIITPLNIQGDSVGSKNRRELKRITKKAINTAINEVKSNPAAIIPGHTSRTLITKKIPAKKITKAIIKTVKSVIKKTFGIIRRWKA